MITRRVTSYLVLASIVLLWLGMTGALAAEGAAPIGHWQGILKMGAAELEIVVDLDQAADGSWSGYFDVPQQGLKDVELQEISVADGKVSFKIAQIPGSPSYAGTLSADGTTLDGTFSQAGQSGELSLERKSATPEAAAGVDPAVAEWIGSGVPGEGAVGAWRGAIYFGSNALRLELSVSADEEGSFSSVLVSVDQGSGDIVADRTLFFVGNLRFEISAISASYVGTLSEDGSQVVGEWQQGPQKSPLTFYRQPAGD